MLKSLRLCLSCLGLCGKKDEINTVYMSASVGQFGAARCCPVLPGQASWKWGLDGPAPTYPCSRCVQLPNVRCTLNMYGCDAVVRGDGGGGGGGRNEW